MSKYIDAVRLKAKLDEHYRKYQSKYMETRTPYTQGLIDALDLAEQVIDTLPEQPVEGLEEAAEKYFYSRWSDGSLDIKDDVIADFIAGAEWMKSKMMEEAVEGFVGVHLREKTADVTVNTGYLPKSMGIKGTDKVRVIIIKGDEK